MAGRWAVFITWKELLDKSPTEDEVLEVIRMCNRQSTVVLLSRLGTHLFLDQFRRNRSETIYMQSFLIANFLDEEILNRAKSRIPHERLDFRRAFHTQQVLTLLKWAALHALPDGGVEPDKDKDARFALGRCLLKTSDLLMSQQMTKDIARSRRSPPSTRKYLRLQLSVGSGNEINNPPPIPNGVIRSKIIFEEIIRQFTFPVDLNKQLVQQTGISLDTYVDLTLGVLSTYIGRTPKQFLEDAGLAVLNPKTLFGPSISPEITERFWDMESSTIEQFAKTLAAPTELRPEQDFTAFRMKPFILLDSGNVICPHPGFIQEKLEIGLFWTIVNNLQGETRQKAFDTWGELFERYVNQALEAMADPSKERYVARPHFQDKKHHDEAFDGMLLSGRVCVVIECKGGFLPNNAKYSENLDQFIKSLEKKFGSDPGAGVEQLARKISQLFAAKPREKRALEGVDLSAVDIVVPVLVVQDNFASSILTVPWLVRSFRDLLRKQSRSRKIALTSLLVLQAEDIETIQTYIGSGAFSLGECLLSAGKRGDPRPGHHVFEFSELLKQFLTEKGIQPISMIGVNPKFDEVLNRVTFRLFNRKFEPLPPTSNEQT